MAEPIINAYSAGQKHAITAVTDNTITIAGTIPEDIQNAGLIEITDSTGNDGLYEVTDVSFDGTDTIIEIAGALTDSTADGDVHSLDVLPESVQSGAAVSIEFIVTGATSAEAVITGKYALASPATLTLGATGGTYSGTITAKKEFQEGSVTFEISAENSTDTATQDFTISIPVEVSSAPMRAFKRGEKI